MDAAYQHQTVRVNDVTTEQRWLSGQVNAIPASGPAEQVLARDKHCRTQFSFFSGSVTSRFRWAHADQRVGHRDLFCPQGGRATYTRSCDSPWGL